MQIGPAIADRVGSLTIFQRSPQWIAPNDDYFAPVGDDVLALLFATCHPAVASRMACQ